MSGDQLVAGRHPRHACACRVTSNGLGVPRGVAAEFDRRVTAVKKLPAVKHKAVSGAGSESRRRFRPRPPPGIGGGSWGYMTGCVTAATKWKQERIRRSSPGPG